MSKGYSIVSHSFLERVCSVPASNGRTKDLVWLTYRNTIGRSSGRETGRTWLVSSHELIKTASISRSTLHRTMRQAVELGLLEISRDGHLWELRISREFIPYPGGKPKTEGKPVPNMGRDNPYPENQIPYPERLNPNMGRDNPYPGGKERAAPSLIKEKNKKEKKEDRSGPEEQNDSSLDRLFLSLEEGTATDQEIDTELVRLIRLEESTDNETAAQARDKREHLLNILESMR